MFDNFQFGVNELIWLGYLLFNYSVILLAYRFWGKIGLLIFVPLSVVLANIQVLKMMTLFGIDTTMGNIAFGGVFLVSDILSEIEGKKYARKLVSIGFVTMAFTTIVMNWAIAVNPAPIDTIQPHLVAIFGVGSKTLIRITISSLIAFAISQLFDVWAYQVIRKWRPSYKDIWIRNNVSTIFGQIIDNSIFTILAFSFTDGIGVKELVVIAFSTYFLELFISVMDTPFVYIAALWKKQGKINELEGN